MLFCTVVSLKVNSMNVFDVKKKVLDAEIFPQHTIVDLNSGSTFLVLFSQGKPLMLKGSKHTHTHTHTDTHTHTPVHVDHFYLLKNSGAIKSMSKKQQKCSISSYTLPELFGTRFVSHRVRALERMLSSE